MENQDYTTPTTKNPTFTASCDYFGYIERGLYKSTFAPKANCTVDTFALTYTEAVTELMKWISENAWIIEENPKCKFTIYMNTGAADRHGNIYMEPVFIISASRAVRTGLVKITKK